MAQGAVHEKLWTPANVVTLLRICLVPVFVVAIISPWPEYFPFWADAEASKPWIAAGIFILLAATDGLDGYLARSRGEVTNFGKFIDPLADKILVAAALLALIELGVLPSWVALVILTREFIVSGIRMVAASQGVVIAASWYGKAKTVAQIVAIVLFIVKDSVVITDPQGVLHNPLADPGIIGVSAGAGLFAMVIMLLFPEQSAMVPLAAFVGAVLSTGIVFFLAWEKGINPLRMILAGVAVATFFGGGMAALHVFYSDRIQGTVMWMAGGFQGRSWGHVEMLLPYSAIGIIGTILCARSLNALQLGDELAKSLGVRVMRMRTILIFLSALLAAVSVSVAGMLGFVGLIVPHIMRLLIGSDHEYLLPCAAIAGGAVVTLADTAARTLFSPLEIPVGIFMSFIGGPFFLYLLKRRMR